MLKLLKWSFFIGIVLVVSSYVTRGQTDESFTNDVPTNSTRIRTIVLDAGHGGKDPGTRGKKVLEKDIALSVVLLVGRKIEDAYPEIKVIYTRKKDVFVNLHERSAIANRNKADLFMSVHCNWNPVSSIKGTETYTMGLHKTQENLEVAKRENDVIYQESDYKKKYKNLDLSSPMTQIMLANYQSAFMAASVRFGGGIQRQIKNNTQFKSRGVKQAGFLVLWETAMPSVLIETGYLSNTEDEEVLRTKEGQEEMAEAIFRAFVKYKSEIES
jgi:N-acetylmuramoyl-L-alanine amidase